MSESVTSTNVSNINNGLGASIMNDSQKEKFNFLIKEIPTKLEEALTTLESTKSKEAFLFSNGSSSNEYTDLSIPCEEIKNDISNLKQELSSLYKTFLCNIDNINTEIESNYNTMLIGNNEKINTTNTD